MKVHQNMNPKYDLFVHTWLVVLVGQGVFIELSRRCTAWIIHIYCWAKKTKKVYFSDLFLTKSCINTVTLDQCTLTVGVRDTKKQWCRGFITFKTKKRLNIGKYRSFLVRVKYPMNPIDLFVHTWLEGVHVDFHVVCISFSTACTVYIIHISCETEWRRIHTYQMWFFTSHCLSFNAEPLTLTRICDVHNAKTEKLVNYFETLNF